MVTMGLDFPDLVAPATLVASARAALADNIVPLLSPAVTLTETRLRLAGPEGEAVFSDFTTATGEASGNNLPPNTAWPVVKLSAFGGRANRGRWFLPGANADQVDSAGTITSGPVTDMNSALGDYMGDLATADFVPVILHSDSELTPTVVLAMFSGNKVYTRGSRLRG
jgi:hypothetical protein